MRTHGVCVCVCVCVRASRCASAQSSLLPEIQHNALVATHRAMVPCGRDKLHRMARAMVCLGLFCDAFYLLGRRARCDLVGAHRVGVPVVLMEVPLLPVQLFVGPRA